MNQDLPIQALFQSADPQNHQQDADHPVLFFFFLVESNEETARLHSKEKIKHKHNMLHVMLCVTPTSLRLAELLLI